MVGEGDLGDLLVQNPPWGGANVPAAPLSPGFFLHMPGKGLPRFPRRVVAAWEVVESRKQTAPRRWR